MGLSFAAAAGLAVPARADTKTHSTSTQHAATASTHHKVSATHHKSKTHVASTHHVHHVTHHYASNTHHKRYAAHYRHSGLQCVPYAREVSHIELTGNAYLWWAKAAGRYARGNAPQEGAVLNFRSIGRMPLGHVAVVTGIIDSRTILVTQANWVRGTITNDVTVQDVSPNNDWTRVEVELGDSKTWGSPYPTYGFIYNHAPTDTVIAATGQSLEVAEAPAAKPIKNEAPNRSLQ